MVRFCVNPSCNATFQVFDGGELYALEVRSKDTEFFWLCGSCTRTLALTLSNSQKLLVTPRNEHRHVHIPSLEGELRLIAVSHWLKQSLRRKALPNALQSPKGSAKPLTSPIAA